MPGMKKGSKSWTQMMIGRMINDIRKIHEDHPETDEDLKKLTNDVAHYIEHNLESEHEPVRPMADVMIEKIFG